MATRVASQSDDGSSEHGEQSASAESATALRFTARAGNRRSGVAEVEPSVGHPWRRDPRWAVRIGPGRRRRRMPS